ncbi:MAG: FAD-dependent oxidoreductase [Acidimicrobiales bacterium]
MARVDMVVVGAGVVGAATAWWAARQGLDVVVLERFEAGHQRGSSHGGVRIFRFAYPQADYVQLAQEALVGWRTLEDETGEVLLEQTGAIDFGWAPGVRATADALAACGAAHQWLAVEEARERFAGFRFDGPVLFHPDGGRSWAARSVAALARSAGAHGADVRYETPVERIEVLGDTATVHTASGSLQTGRLVVAAGAWVTDLLDGLVALPRLRVTCEQPAHFRPLDARHVWPSFIEHASEAAFTTYGLFEPGVGVKLGEHQVGPEVHPDRRSFEPDPVGLERIRAQAQRLLPGVDPEPVAVDTCLYTITDDDDFVIDRVGPITVASACSGHGFKFGPATGRLVCDVAAGGATPARFALLR